MKTEDVSNMVPQDEIEELKVYVEGVLGGKVITENMGYCGKCGAWEDLRGGMCFDCSFPLCPLPKGDCEGRKLVYCGQGTKQIWVDLTYTDQEGKIHCDRDQGFCDKAKKIVEAKKR